MKPMVYYVALISLVLSAHLILVEARHKLAVHKLKSKKSSLSPPPPTQLSPAGDSTSKTFNVMSYGASGGGSEATQSFLNAWKDACAATDSVLLVPEGSIFSLLPTTFDGNGCNGITFQVDGTLLAPTDKNAWSEHPLQWLNFEHVDGITIAGVGKINGQGEIWWSKHNNMPSTKPTAMRFGGCSGVRVTGISIVDSQQTHLKFDDCTGVEVHGIIISSPGNSPNTDGIHVQGSTNVNIHDVTIGCGDDCISIQTGCSGINIERVHCGPSHGISIGSLGQNGITACVSDVTVRDCTITESDNGLRIKSLPNGRGSVKAVSFTNIRVSNVRSAITIDQYYGCNEGGSCGASSVAVSDITYTQVTGTYSVYPVDIICGQNVPCTGITLSGIELTPMEGGNEAAVCQHASGVVEVSGSGVAHCLSSVSSYEYGQYNVDKQDEGGSC